MELKSLEMQIALPRTYDASKNLENIQHEGIVIHEHAKQEMEKELIHKRQHVIKQEQKDPALLKNQSDSKSQQEEHHATKKDRNEKSKQKENNQYHPFKGNHIDFSG